MDGMATAASYAAVDESLVICTLHLVDLEHTAATRHARDEKGIVLVPTPLADPDDPLNWRPKRKYLASSCALLHTWFNGMALSVVYSVLVPPSEALSVTEADLNAGTGYIRAAELLVTLCRDVFSSNPASLMAVTVCGLYARGNGQWIANRVLTCFFATPIEALPETTIVDLFFAHERATYWGNTRRHSPEAISSRPSSTGSSTMLWGTCGCSTSLPSSAATWVYLSMFTEEMGYDRATVGVVITAAGHELVSIGGDYIKGAEDETMVRVTYVSCMIGVTVTSSPATSLSA
ncbi:hypothetical protein DL770_010293 [Monosporascus sp. CRB-9-2]|nr:hypothetical protein DL770_010293 [Monosporascus sp. CRB-9-2]